MIYKNIPKYFRKSLFYRALNPDKSSDQIYIPEEFTIHHKINTVEDIFKVLTVVQFWQFDNIPKAVYKFMYKEDNLEKTLLYLSKNIDPKIQNTLSELIMSLKPQSNIQICIFYNIYKQLNLKIDVMINYIILNKSCLSNLSDISNIKLLGGLLDGIIGPFSDYLRGYITSNSLIYVKEFYSFYYELKKCEDIKDKFPDLIKCLTEFKVMKVDYYLNYNSEEYKHVSTEKRTIFDIFLLTCIKTTYSDDEPENLFEIHDRVSLSVNIFNIIKEFIDNEYSYDINILSFDVPQLFLNVKSQFITLLVSFLIRLKESKILKKLEDLDWDKIEPITSIAYSGRNHIDKNIWLGFMKCRIETLNKIYL